MLLKEWMTKDVITVSPQTSMMQASKLLKEHKFRRLPVVDEKGHLIGIVTDRDIKAASPSKATTLDIHELYYLLSKIKIGEIMTKDPVTVHINDTVQTASFVMLEKKFEGLPVVDDAGHLVGIITETDLFKTLISITGADKGGLQMGFRLSDTAGEIHQILEILHEHKVQIITILTSYETEDGFRRIHIRIHTPEPEKEEKLKNKLETGREILYWTKDTTQKRLT